MKLTNNELYCIVVTDSYTIETYTTEQYSLENSTDSTEQICTDLYSTLLSTIFTLTQIIYMFTVLLLLAISSSKKSNMSHVDTFLNRLSTIARAL